MNYDELEKIRKELSKLIESKAPYEKILQKSVELDELIKKYYNIQ